MPKTPATTKITNPRASRLPRGLGDFSPNVPARAPRDARPDPRSRQLTPSKRVRVTNNRAQQPWSVR